MKQLGFGKQMIKHLLTEELIDLIKTGDDNCNKKVKCNLTCSTLNREGKVEEIGFVLWEKMFRKWINNLNVDINEMQCLLLESWMNFGTIVQDKEIDNVQKRRAKVLDNLIKTYNSENRTKMVAIPNAVLLLRKMCYME
jgi:hypothetical protein